MMSRSSITLLGDRGKPYTEKIAAVTIQYSMKAKWQINVTINAILT